MVFILCMDCAVFYHYVWKDYEYEAYEVHGELNFFILAITLALDAIVSSYFLVCMLYLCCAQTHEDEGCNKVCNWCCNCCKEDCDQNCNEDCNEHRGRCNKVLELFLKVLIPCCMVPYFYTIFGGITQAKIWKISTPNANNSGSGHTAQNSNSSGSKGTVQNATSIWVVTGMMIAPLFAVVSHAGYILIAWVTEPVKTTATFLIALGSIVYLFVMFRQCYATYKRADDKDQALFRTAMCTDSSFSDFLTGKKYWITWFWFVITIPIIPVWILLSHVVNLCCSWKKCRKETDLDLDWDDIEEDNPEDNFSIKAFFMACSWGWPIIGSLAFVLSAFYLIPLPTVELAQYIQNVIQLLIVILASLITYKVFTVDDSDVRKFMRSFKNARATNAEDDVEAAGAKAGKLANLLMQDPTTLQGTTQGTRQEGDQAGGPAEQQAGGPTGHQESHQAGGPAEQQAGGPTGHQESHQAGGPTEHQEGGPAGHQAGGPTGYQAGHQAGGLAGHQAGHWAGHQAGGPAGHQAEASPAWDQTGDTPAENYTR